MAIKKKAFEYKDAEPPLSAMIDIVFLLIIFFVATAALDKEMQDEKIKLALSPHGKPVTRKPLGMVVINVRKDGTANISGQFMSISEITNTLRNTYNRDPSTKVLIRGDVNVPHNYIDKVMLAVTDSRLCRVSFNAEIRKD